MRLVHLQPLGTRLNCNLFFSTLRIQIHLYLLAGDNVIRLLPPLTISDKDINEALNKLDGVMTALSQ